MRLLRVFHSTGNAFQRGWWAVVDTGAETEVCFLWDAIPGPVFEELANLIALLAPTRGLDATIELARCDDGLVRRTDELA